MAGVQAQGGYRYISIIIIYHTAWASYKGRWYIRGRLGRIVARARGRGLHGYYIAELILAELQGVALGA